MGTRVRMGNYDWSNCIKWFIEDGNPYRDGDLPAMVTINGMQIWYKDGEIHRDGDHPAMISDKEGQAWYKDGKKHRDVGPAFVHYFEHLVLPPYRFFEHGVRREPISTRGETVATLAPASWSPVLCFI